MNLGHSSRAAISSLVGSHVALYVCDWKAWKAKIKGLTLDDGGGYIVCAWLYLTCISSVDCES